MWIDVQLSPIIAKWMRDRLGVDASSFAALGYRDSDDREVFDRAVEKGAIIMSKDEDFAGLARKDPSRAKVVLIKSGNTSSRVLWAMIEAYWSRTLSALHAGECVVELPPSI